MTGPSNTDDVIDSRDVIERIAELELESAGRYYDARLRILRELAAEGEQLADWEYGETLIRDSYFTEYARELAEDIGAVSSDASWPLYCIDWERAARELRMDYTSVDFDGVTYWGRS
jgi:antirestriction protein